MRFNRSDWREIYLLRDELEREEDRLLLRRFVRYAEQMEKRLNVMKAAIKAVGGGDTP